MVLNSIHDAPAEGFAKRLVQLPLASVFCT